MSKTSASRTVFVLVACAGILAAGVVSMLTLVSMRQPPAQAEIKERAMRVVVQAAKIEDVPVLITGYGQVRARDVVTVAPEVTGKVAKIHPRLEVGELIPAGEVLFEIDPRDYAARHDNAEATAKQLEVTVERLKKEFGIDKERFQTWSRSRDLAKSEFDRVSQLLAKDQVGTQSGLDQSERAYNQAKDQADQLAQQIDLYPLRIQEAESSLASARAMHQMAQANLDRTVVRAPFDARVKEVKLEAGAYAMQGMQALTLANDTILEISVPLDSREARDWLYFEDAAAIDNPDKAWFSRLKQTPCEIYWTEGEGEDKWTGTLNRVEQFDQQTRTLTVVIQVKGADALSVGDKRLPMVEGMFCKVSIPGRIAKSVVRIPAESLAFDRDAQGFRTLYLAKPGDSNELRLTAVKVKEVYQRGELAYIGEGLKDGDLIVTTHLVNPLDNSLLDTENAEGAEIGS